MSGRDLNVLVVGYGLAGRYFHAPFIRTTPGMAITGVVTSNAERAEEARTDLPDATVLPTLEDALSGAYDLAVVAGANVTHVPYTQALLEAGMHVVVDKPVAANAEQAMALAELARKRGLLVVPFQNRRWDSDFRTALAVAESGTLGLIHRFESRISRMRVIPKPGWRGSPDPADLGGMLYDLGSHVIDQALMLMGPVVGVSASVRSVRPADPTDDDVVVLLTHDSGGLSVLTTSQVAGFAEPRMTLLGTRGALRIDHYDTQEDVLRTGALPGADWGHERAGSEAILRTFSDDSTMTEQRVPLEPGAWPAFYAQVAAAIRGEAPAPVSIDDVIESLRVLDAARLAGEMVGTVRLDPPAGHAGSR